MNSRLIQDAVIRNFEVLGEAAKQIDQATRDAHRSGSRQRRLGVTGRCSVPDVGDANRRGPSVASSLPGRRKGY
jgi:hypothetical protein